MKKIDVKGSSYLHFVGVERVAKRLNLLVIMQQNTEKGYFYPNVNPQTVKDFIATEKKGNFYNKNIRDLTWIEKKISRKVS
jgi:hypothetical protein